MGSTIDRRELLSAAAAGLMPVVAGCADKHSSVGRNNRTVPGAQMPPPATNPTPGGSGGAGGGSSGNGGGAGGHGGGAGH